MMGRLTPQLLASMEIEHRLLAPNDDSFKQGLQDASQYIQTHHRCFAMLIERGTIALSQKSRGATPQTPRLQNNEACVPTHRNHSKTPPTRMSSIETILENIDSATAIISSTGMCSRELSTLNDADNNFYMVGSMGHASAIGLGVALNWHGRVVVLDGDGAALMKLGNLASIGAYHPQRLTHIVFDNHAYDSTGGQNTISHNVDFAAVAMACGYAASHSTGSLASLAEALTAADNTTGPTLIHHKIAPGSHSNPQRPKLSLPELACRFQAYLQRP